MQWSRVFKIVVIASICTNFAMQRTVFGQRSNYPRYPADPTVIEYVDDPSWPLSFPSEIGLPTGTSAAIDKDGRVWCIQNGSQPVQIYSREGRFLKSWTQHEFLRPHSIRFDPWGYLWIADYMKHTVQKFNVDGELILTLGEPNKPGCDERHFDMPTDMVITPAGDIFVCDGYGNRRVVHFNAEGRFIKSFGQFGDTPGSFTIPHAIVVDSKGVLYVGDRNSGRIQLFRQDGTFIEQWSNIIMPWGLWVSDKDDIWCCGTSPQRWYRDGGYPPPYNQMIVRMTTSGKVSQVWVMPPVEQEKGGKEEIAWFHSIALDRQGNLYIGTGNDKKIQKLLRSEKPFHE